VILGWLLNKVRKAAKLVNYTLHATTCSIMRYVISENKSDCLGQAFTQMPRFNSETVSTRKECAIVLSEGPATSAFL